MVDAEKGVDRNGSGAGFPAPDLSGAEAATLKQVGDDLSRLAPSRSTG